MKPKMLVLMGGQGVGKGTFSQMLKELHDYVHIEIGGILRSLPKDSEISRIMAKGELVPDEKILEIIKSNIPDKSDKDVILDGFPRTMQQARWLVENYAKIFDIHVIYLDVPEEVMVARIQKRIREGGGRQDDANEQTIKNRLTNFWETTVPVIKWLSTVKEIKFSDIDVTSEVNENFKRIRNALGI